MSFADDYFNELNKEKKKKKKESGVTGTNDYATEYFNALDTKYYNDNALDEYTVPRITAPRITSTFMRGDEDDIAPVKEESKGSVNAPDFFSWLGDTAMAGLNSFNEGLTKTADVILGRPLQALGWEDNPISSIADYYEDLHDEYKQKADQTAEKMGGGKGFEYGGMLLEGTVAAVPDALLAIMTAGSSTTTSLATKSAYAGGNLLTKAGVTVEQMSKNPHFWTSFARTYGTDYEDAEKNGANPVTAAFTATLTSLANAGIEIGFDGASGFQGLPKNLLKGDKKAVQAWVESSLEEGGEEVLQSFVNNAVAKVTYDPDRELANLKDMATDFGMGAAIGGILGGGQIATQGAINSIQNIKADKLTENEQSVVDKVFEDTIAEKESDGKKLTNKEKNKIYDSIVEQMDKGQLDIDTIESVLGGKTYEEYKSVTEREKALKEEITRLENTLKEQITVKQSERLTEAREELSNLTNKTELKTKLSDEVFGIAKNSRLVESYNERARKGQAFEADLTQYKGQQREAVERAIKSGVLNNTYRAHELVNVLSKIEADKGISFDYTNNAKLKESGFAVEGKTVNGFVKDGGVTLNVQSPKAWQSTVGHEITHILEGTESYGALRETLYSYAESKGELASRKSALTELYKGMNADIDAELTADLVGDYLFTDKNFINKLTGNRTLFQKVWDEIKYLCKVATGKELTEIEKVEREFSKVWKERGQIAQNEDIRETDDSGEGDINYSISVTDKETLDSLNDQVAKGEYDAETNPDGGYYVTYKSMSYWGEDENGNAILRSPMAEYVDGELSNAYLIPKDKSKLNWYQATETIDEGTGLPSGLLVKTKQEGNKSFSYLPASENQHLINEDWSNLYFNLRKKVQKNGKWVNSDVPARYNPYEHSSNSMLNDQFSAAYLRDNLVTVKMYVPISEDNGAYRAKWSKDPTGWSDWKTGTVAGKIGKQKDLQRKVFLSRYAAPVEIVPDSEVAQAYKSYLEGTDVAIPDNVVSPNLLNELKKAGVPIEESGKVKYSVSDSDAKSGIEYDKSSDSYSPVKYSISSWSDSDYVTDRKKAATDMAKNLGVTEEQATKYIDDVNSIAKMIADDKERLSYEPSPDRSAFVSNAEYGGSIDFSTICKKRRLFTGTFEAIQNALPNTALTADEVLEIRKMMKDKGYEVSCGLCYVEGSRTNMGLFTKQFIERYKATNPEYVPNMAEMNTATGQEKIRKEHPEVYEAYEYFMNHYGRLSPTDKALFASQQKPKMYQMSTDYKGEILEKFSGKNRTVEEKNKNGGLRLQSFSDFEIIHLIDSMQVIMDMSRVGLAGQAYTKVPDFAWALGDTGLKINLSLIAKDVDANGRLVLDEVEGMKESDAMALRERYSDNVGTIIVVFNDAQLKAAMADERIDYIIPYHRSQWKTSQYEVMGLPENTQDYTPYQNESYIEDVYNKNGKKQRPSNYMPNNYWDFNKSGKENAEAYLAMCAENNRKPKFSHLLVDNGDGSYSLQPDGSTDGYWKTLIDFKMYNNDGVGVPQNPVVPNFNMEEAQRMLNEYTGGHSKFPVAQDIVNEFVSKHPDTIAPVDVKYSISTDSEGNELSPAVQKRFANSKAVDENGSLKVLYHGTYGGDFYTFDKSKGNVEGDFGSGFYFTDNETDVESNYEGGGPDFENKVARLAERIEAEEDIEYHEAEERARKELFVGSNKHTVYLNIENPAIVGETTLLDYESFAEEYDREDYDSDEDYEGDVEQLIADQIDQIIWDIERKTTVFSADGIAEVLWNAVNEGGIGIEQLKANINELYLEDDMGNFVGNEVTRQIIESLGYDGIIDNTVSYKFNNMGLSKDTTHYIVFKPNQIKSIDNQNPTDNPDIRYSISEETDAEYMSAVQNGDIETAQRLVDEAAKSAGYTRTLYHGTASKFNVFGFGRTGIFTTDNYDMAKTYGDNVISLYGKEGANVLHIDAKESPHWSIEVSKDVLDFSEYPLMRGKERYSTNDISLIAFREGYDVVVIDNVYDNYSAASGNKNGLGTDVVYKDSEQVKSSEAITYDDEGNVIPLSQRFNTANKDMRYSLSNEGEQIAPIGNYSTPLRETALEDIAPVAEGVVENATTTDTVVREKGTTNKAVADKPSFISNKALSLYNEVKEMKKGVKVSKELSYLLDNLDLTEENKSASYNSLRTALINIKNSPAQVVNENSTIESIAREMIDDAYDEVAYGGDELVAIKLQKVQDNIAKNKANRQEAYDRWEQQIAQKQAILDSRIAPTNLGAVRTQLANLESERTESLESFNAKIAQKQAELASKKNKNTKLANNLKMQIENLTRLRDSVDADYIKKIRRLENGGNNPTKLENDLKRQIERLKRLRDSSDAQYAKTIRTLEERATKLQDPKYHRAMRKKAKMQEDAQWAADLLGDTSTWVDKKIGLQYATNTERRNLRDIVRDKNGNVDIAKADAIDDALNGQYNRDEAAKKKELAKVRGKYAKLNITKAEDAYIQMLGELRHNPDTALTNEDIEEYYEQHKRKIDTEKVDKVIEMARKDYDEWLNRVNAELKKQGMKEIPYRQGYFPHFTEPKQNFIQKLLNWKTQDNEIPTSIAGLTETFKPTKSWQSFDKTRYSDKTDYSFMKGFDSYSEGALDWIYHMDTLQKRRAVENHIRYTHSEEGIRDRIKQVYANEEMDASEAQAQIEHILAEAKNPLNNFVQDFTTHTNILAGKKNSLDRTVEQWTNRHIYSVMTNVQNRMSANMVLANVRSALTNFIPITQSWAQVSPARTLQAAKETIANSIKDDGTVAKSAFLTNRLREVDRLYQTNWDKVLDKAGIMFEIVDNFSSQVIWRSKYNQNRAKGMSENAAIMNADQFAENVMAGRSKGNEPTLFNAKNPFVKAFTMFQLEVNNQYGYLFKDVPNDLKAETEHWKLNLAKGYTTAFIGAYIYNAILEKVTGSDAALDPIGIIEGLLRDLGLFDDDEEKEPKQIVTNFVDSVVEELPFVGGLFGGGRIPISSALPYSDDGLTGFVEDVTEGNWGNLGKEMMNPLLNVGLPVAGGQLKKTYQGLNMFSDEHPVSGSYTDSGNLRFPVEDTPLNRAQAAIFGQYASENAREYFDNDYAPLKEKQIQEYIDVEMPIKDYWKYREGLAKQETLEDKFDYIAGLDLPVEKKNILINNIVDRKDDVDMEGYEDFSSLEEFDYATKNPEKYALAKSVGGYASYRAYSDELYDIKADKDENGKSISGSRKEKVINYINNLDADYETKIILFKSEYPADDTYNAEIINYINSRTDLTYDERVSIFTELGFTVSDGNVYWD